MQLWEHLTHVWNLLEVTQFISCFVHACVFYSYSSSGNSAKPTQLLVFDICTFNQLPWPLALWCVRKDQKEKKLWVALSFPSSFLACVVGSCREVRKDMLGFPGSVWFLEHHCLWTSLMVQWLRICLPMQGTRVRFLVQEDFTCLGATKAVQTRHSHK